MPVCPTRNPVSPHGDVATVTSERRGTRTKSLSNKRGLYHKVFKARDVEPRLVGYRKNDHEATETTPLREQYVFHRPCVCVHVHLCVCVRARARVCMRALVCMCVCVRACVHAPVCVCELVLLHDFIRM